MAPFDASHELLFVFHCNVYLLPLLRYAVSNIIVTLKSWFGIVQGHWRWRRSIYYFLLVCALFWSYL